jgi:hypothetical protein
MTRKIAVSAVTLTAALLILSTPARAANTTNVTLPISGSLFDSCSGENVDYTGTVHVVADVTVNGNHVTLVQHENFHVTATGESSGATYVGDESFNDTENFSLTSPQEELNFTEPFTLIGQGSTPNLKSLATEHVTVNADGTVTVNRIDITSSCH